MTVAREGPVARVEGWGLEGPAGPVAALAAVAAVTEGAAEASDGEAVAVVSASE